MAEITSEMHVKILGLVELDLLLDAIERNLAVIPAEVRSAYSDLKRERPRLSLVGGKDFEKDRGGA